MLSKLKAKLKKISSTVKRLSPYPKKVKILAVSKKRTVEEIKEAIKAGVTCFGENYLKEAEEKFGDWKGEKNFELHMVGHLQSNKVRRAVQLFDCIQSVDNYKLAERINRIAKEYDKAMPIFVQVNLTEDENRNGFNLDFLRSNLPPILKLPNINVRGIMIMAPKDAEEKDLLKIFKTVHKLADEFELKEISAGMSNDYPIALKEGSNIVRLGSALFGERKEKE